MEFPELTYASPNDPRLKRWVIHAIEELSGRKRFLPLYTYWKKHIVPRSRRPYGEMLELIGTTLQVDARQWPPRLEERTPLVIIANHPFGIGDGIAILALAEELGRPFKVIINNQLLRIPEIKPYSLPIDFDETREAMATNLATRKEALRLIAEGTTIIVFPAGGVATARSPFGKAVDLPWKLFTAKLIQSAKAAVLPVWFEGQNGPLFQIASKLSLTLRLSLLVSEFRKFAGGTVTVRIGDVVPFDGLEHGKDRKGLTEELHQLVHALAKDDPARKRSRISRVKRKARGMGRLARRKAKGVGRFARRKAAAGVGRIARLKRRHGPGDPHAPV